MRLTVTRSWTAAVTCYYGRCYYYRLCGFQWLVGTVSRSGTTSGRGFHLSSTTSYRRLSRTPRSGSRYQSRHSCRPRSVSGCNWNT